MSKTSYQFFEALESSMRVSNLLTISGSSEDIQFFLETQFFNGKKKVDLKKIDLHSMSLRNHIYEEEHVDYEKITILCDEADIKPISNHKFQINVNFYSINGFRQKFLEQISKIYPNLEFTNSFFNIENDYCGRAIFEYGSYQLIEHDLFSNRFGSSFVANFSLSTLFTEQLVYEIPITISHYENPFDFYQIPHLELFILRVDMESLELLNLLTIESTEHEELLEKLNYSSLEMIKKLTSTKFKIISLENDNEFSFHNYPIIDLANFNNILTFYKNNFNVFNAFYTSLLLEKNYLEKRKERLKRNKKEKKDKDKK